MITAKSGGVESGGRLAIIDGLRGIAALAVVIFHLSEVSELRNVPVLGFLASHGNLGVEVFFVISGFVIAFSVRNNAHTAGFFLRFVVRRVIRLDPPYWSTIAAELALLKLGLLLFPLHDVAFPGGSGVLAHLVYLQGFLGIPHILPIFWTLCYEVQFYLFLVGALVVVQELAARSSFLRARKRGVLLALGTVSFLYSLAVDAELLVHPVPGLFVDRWYQFCLGIVTLAVVKRWLPVEAVVLAWLVTAGLIFAGPHSAYSALSAGTCVLTSMTILLAIRPGALATIAEHRSLQYLGRVSYSLYLIHLVVGWRFISVMLRLLPGDQPLAVRSLLFVAGIALSIGISHAMFAAIERPALRLAGRVPKSPTG